MREEEFVVSACYDYRTQKGVFEELCHLYGPRTELYRSNNAVTIDFPLSLFGLFFMRFIHICRAFSYITKMRFHYQLMRF